MMRFQVLLRVEKVLKEFNQALQELEARYHVEKREIFAARDAWIGSQWPKYKLGHYTVAEHEWNQWECKDSPIGICIYDDSKDPVHDFCVFCEMPEERK